MCLVLTRVFLGRLVDTDVPGSPGQAPASLRAAPSPALSAWLLEPLFFCFWGFFCFWFFFCLFVYFNPWALPGSGFLLGSGDAVCIIRGEGAGL